MGSSYQKFTKDVLIIGITNILVALSGIILLPLLTKTLGAHDYGIWAQVQVTISLALGFVGLGLPYAMTRFLPAKTNREEIQEEFYSVFYLVFLVTLVTSVVMIVAANFIARAFFNGAIHIVRITGLIILVWSLDWVFLSFFRSFLQMKRYAIFTIADMYGQLGLIAYVVLNGYGLFNVLLTVLAIRVVIFFILFFLIKHRIGIRRPRFSRIREYLNFGLPTIPGNISSWVVLFGGRYVIGYFLGVAPVGIYSAGHTLGSIPFVFAITLGFVLTPTLSKLYDEGRMNEVKTYLRYSLKYLLMIAIPFVCGATVLSKQVLGLFSTIEIALQGHYVVPIVALATLILCICGPFEYILVLVKKTKIISISHILAALINLGLNLLIVPVWGILGAAITTLITYSVLLGIEVLYSLREFRFVIDWHFIIKSLIASAIMSSVIWRISTVGNITVIATIIIGIIVYTVVLLLLRGAKKEEIRFFRTLFQRGS